MEYQKWLVIQDPFKNILYIWVISGAIHVYLTFQQDNKKNFQVGL